MRQKILFIDRDGTIIVEPPVDFQVDSLEKLSFVPGAITALQKIQRELDFKLVMVTNQDGLGTDSFPENTFWPPQNKMLEILEGEGITFDAIHIDPHFEHENAPTRKPGTGMLTKYIEDDRYDLEHSYVIGDRATDVQLALNLNAKSIYIANENDAEATFCTMSWNDIYQYLATQARIGKVHRVTKETDIEIVVNLDGTGKTVIETGLGFFDHMLDQIGRHANVDLSVKVKGDLHIDEHHTIEDTAIALGEAFFEAFGSKKGIERYGFLLPMDDCLAQAAIDFSGRSWLEWDVNFKRDVVGDMPTEMVFHFFKSFSDAAKCNLNMKAEGANDHHKIESLFKALAKAIKMAKKKDLSNMKIPSTKGVL